MESSWLLNNVRNVGPAKKTTTLKSTHFSHSRQNTAASRLLTADACWSRTQAVYGLLTLTLNYRAQWCFAYYTLRNKSTRGWNVQLQVGHVEKRGQTSGTRNILRFLELPAHERYSDYWWCLPQFVYSDWTNSIFFWSSVYHRKCDIIFKVTNTQCENSHGIKK